MNVSLRVRLINLWKRIPHLKPPSPRAHSAKAALVCGSFAIFIAMAWAATALETTRPQWRDPEFGHRLFRLREIQREHASPHLVLVLGTSRTQNAIQPSAMDISYQDGSPRVFNFGQSGSSPLKVLLTLLRLLDEGIRPGAVIVEVLPLWLTLDGAAEEQFQDKVPQLSIADLQRLAPYCERPEVLRNRWLAARAAPWHTQRVSLMSHWLPQWVPWQSRIAFQWQTMESDGFVPFLYEEPPASFRATATAQTHQEYSGTFQGFRPSTVSLRAMHDLVDLCQANGISVAFFVPPVAPLFREWFEAESWKTGDSNLHSFARELGVDVFPAPVHFANSDFADGQHMLRGAAGRYNRWLAEVHLSPWLSQKQK